VASAMEAILVTGEEEGEEEGKRVGVEVREGQKKPSEVKGLEDLVNDVNAKAGGMGATRVTAASE